jgi:DNA polymerase-3 subunit chi
MTEVDFYILDAESPDQRKDFACRLAAQVFRQGHQVYIHTDDEPAAREMDDLLWSFRPDSFLPHSLLGGEHADRVAIGWQADPSPHSDVMINLGLSVPEFVGRFRRVTEVVVTQAAIRDPLRKSYKYYKDRGYPLKERRL